MKTCPHCAEDIQDEAIKCRYCHSDLTVPVASPAAPVVGEGAIRFTHSGERFVLGYTVDSFAIWDRNVAGRPAARFPRSDAGWGEAWNQFTASEPSAMAVPHTFPPPDQRQFMVPLLPTRLPQVWTATCLAIAAGLAVILLGVSLAKAVSLSRLPGSAPPGPFQTQWLNSIGGYQALLWLAALLVAIPWLIWQRRAHRNLVSLGVEGLTIPPALAVWCWFIPVASLALPLIAIRELWRASEPAPGPSDWKRSRTPIFIWIWWAAFLLRTVFLFWAAALPDFPNTGQTARTVWLFAAFDLATIAAAILAMLVVRGVDAREGRLESMRFSPVAPSTSSWGVAGAV